MVRHIIECFTHFNFRYAILILSISEQIVVVVFLLLLNIDVSFCLNWNCSQMYTNFNWRGQ